MSLHELHITRRRHKTIVALGIVACGLVTAVWPEMTHMQAGMGTAMNLFWLLADPIA